MNTKKRSIAHSKITRAKSSKYRPFMSLIEAVVAGRCEREWTGVDRNLPVKGSHGEMYAKKKRRCLSGVSRPISETMRTKPLRRGEAFTTLLYLGVSSSRSVVRSKYSRFSRHTQWSRMPAGSGLVANEDTALRYWLSVVVEC